MNSERKGSELGQLIVFRKKEEQEPKATLRGTCAVKGLGRQRLSCSQTCALDKDGRPLRHCSYHARMALGLIDPADPTKYDYATF